MNKISPRSLAQLASAVSVQEVEPIKRRGKNRKRTDAEIEYQGRVAELGCICCHIAGRSQEGHTEIHHHRAGRLRSDCHFDVIPLCKSCHTGRHSIHGDKSIMKSLGHTPESLLEKVKELLDN